MSLQQFQRALSAMTIRPELAAEVRHLGAPALQAYKLTPLEQTRLVSVSRQRGMDLNCTLARGNRFGPIFDVLPLVCTLLKPSLRELLGEFWSSHQPCNYQLSGEAEAFTIFLRKKITDGFVQPYLEEILHYETALWELVRSLHSKASKNASEAFREVAFQHDPRKLLPPLEAGEFPCSNLPSGNYLVRVMLCDKSLILEIK